MVCGVECRVCGWLNLSSLPTKTICQPWILPPDTKNTKCLCLVQPHVYCNYLLLPCITNHCKCIIIYIYIYDLLAQ